MNYKFDRAWAEVNLDNIANNIKELKSITQSKMMCAVKADAYGHGAIEVSKTLIENGVEYLAVATLDEGIQLRHANITAPIFILAHVDSSRVDEIIEYDFIQAVFNYSLAKSLSDKAQTLGKKPKVHIKVDTGMTRQGIFTEGNAVAAIKEIWELPNIEVEGIFTHFAAADDPSNDYTFLQFNRFMSLIEKLKQEDIKIPLKHLANSAVIIEHPEMHLDIVRPGISTYGLYPSFDVDVNKICLKPAMTFKAKIVRIEEFDKGTKVSYGGIYTTTRKTKIATIPIGYADGYTRLLIGKAKMLVNNQLCPVIGKICMDNCMLDITDVQMDLKVGDEVVVFGEDKLSIDDLASIMGTINYEITCMVGRRVPRVYFKNEKIVGVMNYLV